MTTAYAYKDSQEKIYPETVSPSEVGAKVNTIAIATMGHVMPKNDWTSKIIDEVFINSTGGQGKIILVEIKECQTP